ncbi:NAD-dependent epimerase/dehydratase family protein [Roseateles sp. NT4]|uniref:NAD-dependent epimerase/dehydratase family protein n=1 Tax=Roseateles sp. NT4 TaxID=3453715 RepID=UPI003EECA6C5
MNPLRILVIGGTRFFGILLVEKLVAAGHSVTIATRGNAGDPFGDSVRRLRVDRRDIHAMRTTFQVEPDFDVVFDQMCYSPLDAAIVCDVLGGRTGHYVMASTIEVYSQLHGKFLRAFREDDIDLPEERVDIKYPWYEPNYAEVAYGKGKRQAEAYLMQDGRLPFSSVRIGHVLAGPQDFTGRLEHYVSLARQQKTFWYGERQGVSSFISADEISRFMLWMASRPATGPVNAASSGPLSALDIYSKATEVLSLPQKMRSVTTEVSPSEMSPFDYPSNYAMDTWKATAQGFSFTNTSDWLAQMIIDHDEALSLAADAALAR